VLKDEFAQLSARPSVHVVQWRCSWRIANWC